MATGPPWVSPWRTPPRTRTCVLLELHPGAAAVAEPAPGQGVGEVVGGDADMGGQPLEDRDQRGTVGLACCEPSEHGVSLSAPDAPQPARSPRRDPTVRRATMNGPKGNGLLSSERSRRTIASARPGTAKQHEADPHPDRQRAPARPSPARARPSAASRTSPKPMPGRPDEPQQPEERPDRDHADAAHGPGRPAPPSRGPPPSPATIAREGGRAGRRSRGSRRVCQSMTDSATATGVSGTSHTSGQSSPVARAEQRRRTAPRPARCATPDPARAAMSA